MADAVTRQERKYLLREGQLLGLIVGPVLFRDWWPAYVAWTLLVLALWASSLIEQRRLG